MECHVGVDDDARHEASGESRFPGGPEVGEEGVEFLIGFPYVEGELVERPQGLYTDGAGDGVEVGLLSGLNLDRRRAFVAPGVVSHESEDTPACSPSVPKVRFRGGRQALGPGVGGPPLKIVRRRGLPAL